MNFVVWHTEECLRDGGMDLAANQLLELVDLYPASANFIGI